MKTNTFSNNCLIDFKIQNQKINDSIMQHSKRSNPDNVNKFFKAIEHAKDLITLPINLTGVTIRRLGDSLDNLNNKFMMNIATNPNITFKQYLTAEKINTIPKSVIIGLQKVGDTLIDDKFNIPKASDKIKPSINNKLNDIPKPTNKPNDIPKPTNKPKFNIPSIETKETSNDLSL